MDIVSFVYLTLFSAFRSGKWFFGLEVPEEANYLFQSTAREWHDTIDYDMASGAWLGKGAHTLLLFFIRLVYMRRTRERRNGRARVNDSKASVCVYPLLLAWTWALLLF